MHVQGGTPEHRGPLRCAGRVEAVNPWELEVDPDFERTEDEIKRDQEAEQRALRAAAIAMRRCGASQPAACTMRGLSSRSWVYGSMLHSHTEHRHSSVSYWCSLDSRPWQQEVGHDSTRLTMACKKLQGGGGEGCGGQERG